eukprot:TRINITY_DN10633_c0_g1_i1.p1 TRINITY_DN10633_c0_g1~~TRINITY_DN10633_c0_g1_i1.p1  ORF type:complete len:445 (-),score=48.78 TRINITY_DN10633_c0_g1_i1:3-1337(-)
MALTLKERIYILKKWIQTILAHIVIVPIFKWLRTRFFKNSITLSFPLHGDNYISIPWFRGVLVAKKVISKEDEITKIELTGLDENRGFAGTMKVITVHFTKRKPLTFVMKTNDCVTLSKRFQVICQGRIREALFYKNFVDIPQTPFTVYSFGNSFTGDVVLIMELMPKFHGLNFYFGNQIWGGFKTEELLLRKPDDTAMTIMKEVVDSFVDLHAKYWNDRALLSPKFSWVKAYDWYHGRGEESWTLAIKKGESCWSSLKKNKNIKFSSRLINIIDESYKRTSWGAFQSYLKEGQGLRNKKVPPFTLTHGDLHAANLFYSSSSVRDKRSVVGVDWSEVSIWEPMTDLGQMVISDVQEKIDHQELVSYYWNKLIDKGVSPSEFPLSTALEFYQRGPVEKWIWMVCIMPGFNVPDVAMQYFHDKLINFIQENGNYDYYILKPIVTII